MIRSIFTIHVSRSKLLPISAISVVLAASFIASAGRVHAAEPGLNIFSASNHHNPFTGAFIEVSAGLAHSNVSSSNIKDKLSYTAHYHDPDPNISGSAFDRDASGNMDFSGSSGGNSNSGVVRITLGYGLPVGSFNLAPSLFYIPSSFSLAGGASLRDLWGAQLQPGFHLPLSGKKSILFYGTLGIASGSLSQPAPSRSLDVPAYEFRGDVQKAYHVDIPGLNRSKTTNGLVLGLGAKLAFTERVYGLLDFTYIRFKKVGGGSFESKGADRRDVDQVTGTKLIGKTDARTNWNRDYSAGSNGVSQKFFTVGVGYRFF